MKEKQEKTLPLVRLLNIMARLRSPESGCPWDLIQTFETISPYTIEEAYEVDDAIRKKDYSELKEELGDLLLQVVFHSRMAEEQNLFNFEDVCNSICNKMISRHPHVFGDERKNTQQEAVNNLWEKQKHEERTKKNMSGALDGVALALPSLMRAQKLQKRTERANIENIQINELIEKTKENLETINTDPSTDNYGELLFTIAHIGHKLNINAETTLRETNAKYEKRIKKIEANTSKKTTYYSDL